LQHTRNEEINRRGNRGRPRQEVSMGEIGGFRGYGPVHPTTHINLKNQAGKVEPRKEGG